AERRQRLPEFLPDAARGTQTETVVRRDEGAGRYFDHPAFLDAKKRTGVVDSDHKDCIDETATMNEPCVGVHQAGNLVDHAKAPLGRPRVEWRTAGRKNLRSRLRT